MVYCPEICVVVRTLGRSEYLADALESLARQSWRGFEVVVVDMGDGRNDQSIERFATRLPALRCVVPATRSRPAALNAGVASSRAPLIAILDEDNLYDAQHLERLVSGLENTAADYVYTGVRHATYARGGAPVACREVAIPFRFDRLLLGNYIYATGSAYRKSIWERVGGYDERFTVFEDWDFLIRVAQAGSVTHLPLVSGESRKFTGIDGVANFDLEIEAVRRCHAGIHWTHRGLFRDELRTELKAAYAEHCRRRQPPRRGLLARSVAGWRVEFGRDLLAWWWWTLRPWSRRRAA